jgi:L-arabinose isomerase
VGLYTIGLNAYWAQFPGLRERLINYGKSIEGRLSKIADIKNYGLVDSEHVARMAGEWFNAQNVDIIFLHCGTYCTSASVLPIHQICKAPVVVLNLQPSIKLNYDKCDTGEWLANCGACVAPEIANSFHRSGIPFRIINGLLGLESTLQCSTADETTFKRPEAKKAWEEITEWTIAAGIKHSLRNCRFGFLGGNYCGMLDLYSDFTMLQAQTGMHVEIVEMCDLDRCLQSATKAEINAKMREINSMFEISGDSPTDPNVKQPTKEQLDWSAKVAAAQEKLVSEYGLDALAYYYHSSDGNPYEELQAGFIVGHSLLTAKGVPCAGEADLKTALAMKICDLLGAGGSFCEIVAVDYDAGTILIGHDGPFHISISNGRPILRGMGVYHGKKGTGISVEAKVRSGDITTLNVTQSSDGKLKFIISEATATKGQIMTIGNTQTHARFKTDPDTHMTKWFSQYPTHHFALSVGHNAGIFKKVAELLGIETVEL